MRKSNSVLIIWFSVASMMLFGCGQTSEATVDAPVMDSATEEKVVEVEAPAIASTEASSIEEVIEEVVKVADSEDDLLAVLSAACSDTLMMIIRDDFDGDGVFEAFAATSKDPYAVYFNDPDNASDCYDDFTIWYVTPN